MSASSIMAGRAFIELAVKGGAKALKDIKAIGDQLSSAGSTVVAAGGAITAAGLALGTPLAAAVAQFTGIGGELDDVAKRTGVGAEALSELKYAAEQSGASFGDVEKGLRKMQQNLVDAAGGSKQAQQALSQLGLSTEELAGLSPDQQFMKIAERIGEIKDPAQRTSAAMDAFGKSGASMLKMFDAGGAGIQAMRDQARELGITMSDDNASAAAVLSDLFATLATQVKYVGAAIGSALAPELTSLAGGFTKTMAGLIRWIKENRGLVVTVAKVAVGLLAAGAAVTAIGGAMMGAGAILGGIVAAFGTLASVAGFVGAAIAFIISPVGLVIGAVVGLAGYFLWASGSMGKSMDWLKSQFTALAGFVGQVFGGIRDALAAGDIGLAAEVGLAGLQVAWATVLDWLSAKWVGFRDMLLNTWDETVAGIAILFTNIAATIETAWVSAFTAIGTAWAEAVAFMKKQAVGISSFSTGVAAEALEQINKNFKSEGSGNALDRAAKYARGQAIVQEVGKGLVVAQAERERTQKLKELEANQAARLKEIEANRGGAENAIGGDLAAKQQARADASAAAIAASRANLADKQRLLQEKLGQAQAARAAADAQGPAAALAARDLQLPGADLGGDKKEAARSAAVGTFSSDISGFLAGGVAERQLAAAEKANVLLDAIKNKIVVPPLDPEVTD